VSATFTPGKVTGPAGQFLPALKVGDHHIGGYNNLLDVGTTASLDSRGELWVGYRKVASC